MYKNKLTLILAALLIVSGLASCGDSETKDPVATAAETESTTIAETKPDAKLQGLDFGGETITFFCSDLANVNGIENVFVEDENGEVINDAVYKRNMLVEELLNIEFNPIYSYFSGAGDDPTYTRIRSDVMGGGEYEVILFPAFYSSTLVAEGIFSDMTALPHVDFSQSYWSKNYIDSVTIDGRVYTAAGDGLLQFMRGCFCFPFNQEMAQRYDVENLYDLVYDGKWTLDKMATIVKPLYSDLNGDGKRDVDDQYGMDFFDHTCFLAFLDSSKAPAFTRNGDEFIFSFDSERNVTLFDKVFSMAHENEGFLATFQTPNIQRSTMPFFQGNALMTTLILYDINLFRDLDFTYGLLPYPKFDEAQDEYVTMVSGAMNVFAVPVTAAGSEKVGAVLEAMSIYGEELTTPAYYEVAMKTKYTNDDDSAKMFDIIKNGSCVNIGEVFAMQIGTPNNAFRDVGYPEKEGTWASTIAENKEMWITKLNEFVETVRGLES